jgi:hypothetical protein
MTLEEILNEKMTDDREAEGVEENYKGLLQTPSVGRDPSQEMFIKFNKLERRAEPKAPILKQEPPCYDGGLVCPSCGKPITNVWGSRTYQPHFCHFCGQALKWEV